MTSLFLMSPPRRDWRVRGRANPFSERTDASGGDALRDWLRVADAIEAHGARVVVMPSTADAALTGLPYTAEAGVLGHDASGRVFVVAHLTPAHRVAEAEVVDAFARGIGLRTRRVQARFEGQGDVLRVDDARTVFTVGDGRYARTERAAIDEVLPLLPGRVHVLPFRADPWFHGNTFFGAYSSRAGVLALCCDDALAPDARDGLRAFLPDVRVASITREESVAYATNALQLGDVVLAPAGLPPRIAALFREHGLTVEPLALPALFGAGGGAAVCLTNRLDGLTADEVPPACLYRAQRASLAAGLT